jgi:uncharacterized membrane protein
MRRLFGPFFVFAGVMHFVKTEWYEAIVPSMAWAWAARRR